MVDSISSLSSVNQPINTGSNFTPHIQTATAEDTQDLQRKISELKIENLELKVKSLESAAIKSGEMQDPYTKPEPCRIQPEATQPQNKLAELNAAKAELAAAKAELINPSGNNSNKNIKDLSKDLLNLNVENKELQRNALLEEKEALAAKAEALEAKANSQLFRCNPTIQIEQENQLKQENELKIKLEAAEKELKNAQDLLSKNSNDNDVSQFTSKGSVDLLKNIAIESISDSKEFRKEQLETKIQKLEANLTNRPSYPQQCSIRTNDEEFYSNTQKLLDEARAELATI